LLHLYTILPQETEKFILRFPEVVRHPPEGEGCGNLSIITCPLSLWERVVRNTHSLTVKIG
jgi:hypothetical protein